MRVGRCSLCMPSSPDLFPILSRVGRGVLRRGPTPHASPSRGDRRLTPHASDASAYFSVSRDETPTRAHSQVLQLDVTSFQVYIILLPAHCAGDSHWLSCPGLPTASGPGPVGPAGRLSPSAQLGFADLLNTDTLHTETCWILSTDHSKMKCQLHWPCDSIAATRGVSLIYAAFFLPPSAM